MQPLPMLPGGMVPGLPGFPQAAPPFVVQTSQQPLQQPVMSTAVQMQSQRCIGNSGAVEETPEKTRGRQPDRKRHKRDRSASDESSDDDPKCFAGPTSQS